MNKGSAIKKMKQQMYKEKDIFETAHFALAAYLFYRNHKLVGLKGRERKSFLFEATPELKRDIELFYAKKAEVEPEDFMLKAKALKSRLYEWKED